MYASNFDAEQLRTAKEWLKSFREPLWTACKKHRHASKAPGTLIFSFEVSDSPIGATLQNTKSSNTSYTQQLLRKKTDRKSLFSFLSIEARMQ